MVRELRLHIIDAYLEEGSALPLDRIGERLGLSTADLNSRLAEQPRLAALCALSPEQALALLDAYGAGLMFSPELDSALLRLRVTKRRINELEERARKNDD